MPSKASFCTRRVGVVIGAVFFTLVSFVTLLLVAFLMWMAGVAVMVEAKQIQNASAPAAPAAAPAAPAFPDSSAPDAQDDSGDHPVSALPPGVLSLVFGFYGVFGLGLLFATITLMTLISSILAIVGALQSKPALLVPWLGVFVVRTCFSLGAILILTAFMLGARTVASDAISAVMSGQVTNFVINGIIAGIEGFFTLNVLKLFKEQRAEKLKAMESGGTQCCRC